jgi:phospholipid N-methyltransferase
VADEALEERLRDELAQFKGLWKGGYYEGDPLDPLGKSSYGRMGFMSVLYATYLHCIRPYVGPTSRVLEIGPGKGAWTRTFVERGASEIWCLDALSREHNGFDDYVGARTNVHYFQVTDFTCSELPDAYFDYVFSFGCFCHISAQGTREYLTNLYRKLAPAANGFILVADYDKYNAAIADESLRINRLLYAQRNNRLMRLWRKIVDALIARKYSHEDFVPKSKLEVDTPSPGRFYHLGARETCEMLQGIGFEIVSPDVGTIFRDPIIHFRRPTG